MRRPGHLPPGFMQPLVFSGGGLIRAGGGFVEEPPADAGSANTHSCEFLSASKECAGLDVTTGHALNAPGAKTVGFWYKPNSLPTSYDFLVCNYVAAGSRMWAVSIRVVAGTYYIYGQVTFDGTNASQNRWTITPSAGTWAHYAWTWAPGLQATQHNLTVNGTDLGAGTIVVANESAGSNSHDGNGTVMIGDIDTVTGGSGCTGRLDDVRVWSVVRTPTQIADNRSAELSPQANLAGYYKLNNDYTDSAGSAYDLSVKAGTPTFEEDPAF